MSKHTVATMAKELGIQMVDAKQDVIVEVTEQDAKRSVRNQPTQCALARACKRENKRLVTAYFFKTAAWLRFDDKIIRYLLPDAVQALVVAFDKTGRFPAGEYLMKRPPKSRKLGARSEYETGVSKIKRKRKPYKGTRKPIA